MLEKRKKNKFLTDFVVAQATPIHNSLPYNIRLKNIESFLVKKLNEHFWKEYFEGLKNN